MNDKFYQDVEDGLTQAESGRKSRPGVRAWQQEKRKSRSKVDPFAMLVFLYLIFSVSCLLWFGWKYYTLKREVARLSEIVVTLFEEKAAGSTVNPTDPNDSANTPLSGGQAAPDRADTAAAPPLSENSTMYTVQDGDNWWDISEKAYGTGTYYLKLTAYNKMDNQRLYKGLVVELPPKEVLDTLP